MSVPGTVRVDASDPGDLTDVLVGFARTLRACGVHATPDRLHATMRAVDQLRVHERRDVYWAGRLTLCGSHEDVTRFDRAFDAYFTDSRPVIPRAQPRTPTVRLVAVPADAPEVPEAQGDPGNAELTAATASRLEVLRRRDLAGLDAAERAQATRLLAALRVGVPVRRSRRTVASRRGSPDRRRTLQAMLRVGGEPTELRRHAGAQRPRRVVVLVDVSGSMAPYADAVLVFAHALRRAQPRTEVFTIGTRLTRVTREISAAEPEAALVAVSAIVPDWSGGTRLGAELAEFLRGWGQRGTARGAVVVIASDGWERGDTALLGAQMARLRRLAHRVVWVNPHKARPGFAPLTGGMVAALPYVDDFVTGHSVDAYERLAGVIAAGGTRRA